MSVHKILNGEYKSSMIKLISTIGVALSLIIKNISCYLSRLLQFSINQKIFNLKNTPGYRSLSSENDFDISSSVEKRAHILRIEICSEKMATLLAYRLICASDIRCLDIKSKQCLQALCLKTCLYKSTYSCFYFQDKLKITDLHVLTKKP